MWECTVAARPRPKKIPVLPVGVRAYKNPSLKIFMEHLEKAVSCVILVPNRMKIGQEMAEYGRKTI